MKKSAAVSLVFSLACVFLLPSFVGATIEEAKQMVLQAEAYYRANGKEKALKEYNDPKGDFVKGDIYVFAYDLSGTIIAHPVTPKLVGVNTLEVPDVTGKYWRKEAMEKVAQDGVAIVDYKFTNPVSGKVEEKTTYFKKVGDIILGCGTYK